MGIANELSSDVAAAVFARKNDRPRAETKELAEIVLDFHDAMRALVGEERRRRASQWSATDAPQSGGQAASGSR